MGRGRLPSKVDFTKRLDDSATAKILSLLTSYTDKEWGLAEVACVSKSLASLVRSARKDTVAVLAEGDVGGALERIRSFGEDNMEPARESNCCWFASGAPYDLRLVLGPSVSKGSVKALFAVLDSSCNEITTDVDNVRDKTSWGGWRLHLIGGWVWGDLGSFPQSTSSTAVPQGHPSLVVTQSRDLPPTGLPSLNSSLPALIAPLPVPDVEPPRSEYGVKLRSLRVESGSVHGIPRFPRLLFVDLGGRQSKSGRALLAAHAEQLAWLHAPSYTLRTRPYLQLRWVQCDGIETLCSELRDAVVSRIPAPDNAPKLTLLALSGTKKAVREEMTRVEEANFSYPELDQIYILQPQVDFVWDCIMRWLGPCELEPTVLPNGYFDIYLLVPQRMARRGWRALERVLRKTLETLYPDATIGFIDRKGFYEALRPGNCSPPPDVE